MTHTCDCGAAFTSAPKLAAHQTGTAPDFTRCPAAGMPAPWVARWKAEQAGGAA